VLEPGAWVLRIARNECLGRLRQRARVPGSSSLDGLEPRSSGGMERLAEVRDQMRVARDTLRALPVPEREAFVLREWLGLGTAEVALAMSLTSGEIESLAGRARRSLVLAVGGLEPAVGCADTRAALETGSLGRAGAVHLLRCPMCRGVRRALRPPEARGVPAIVGQRLAGALPGFASGGGGIVAVLTTKAAAAPLLAKTAAIVAAALVTVDVAQHEIQRAAPSHKAVAAVRARGGEAQALAVAPPATAVVATTTVARASVVPVAAPKTEGAQAQAVDLRVSRTSHVRGGSATSVDDSTTGHVARSGHRDAAPSSRSGADGTSSEGGDGSRHSAISSGGSDGTGSHEHDTSATTTHTSGTDDHSTGSHRTSGTQASDGETSGSGHDGAPATSDHSGDGGSTSGSGGTGTITAPTVPTGGGDGSAASGDLSGDSGATMSGDGGGGGAAPVVTTAVVTTADPAVPPPSGDG
jgi:hypothetical protein